MYQSGLFEDDLLEEWEVSADHTWEVTKRKFRDQFSIVTQASNGKTKRSRFESINSLHDHPPFSYIPLPPTPAPTQYSREYDDL